MQSSSKIRILAFSTIIILGYLIYSNTFHAPFVFDDAVYVENNVNIRALKNFFDLSGTRYITFLSFALNYWAGKLDTFGYHLVNTGIHLLNAVFVYLLVVLTLKTPVIKGSPMGGDQDRTRPEYIAFTASIIFLTHPVNTQAVTYISQRFASLATLFYLLSIILYIKGRIILEERHGGNKGIKPWVFYGLSVIIALGAQKTKEISFTLPFVIAFFELSFFPNRKKLIRKILLLSPFLLCLIIIPLSVLTSKASGIFSSGIDEYIRGRQFEEIAALSGYEYLITQFRVIVKYLRLLILPINQCLDYFLPPFKSFFAPAVLLSFTFLSLFFIATIYLYVRARKACNAYGLLISAGFIWFFITLSVESSIIPIQDVIFEHRVYLPGIGIIIAFTAFIFYIKDSFALRSAWLAGIVLIIAVIFSLATYKRNIIWKDELSLWQDVVEKAPHNPRGHNNVGNMLYRKGAIQEAMYYFDKSLQLKPDYWEAANNMGLILTRLKRPGEALAYLERAIKITPESADVQHNYANALMQLGRVDEAVEHYRMAVLLKPFKKLFRSDWERAQRFRNSLLWKKKNGQ